MKIATFNINSINARLPLLLDWLSKVSPDVVMLQEIKTEFNSFPFFEINMAGYQAKVLGQKGYNGVAILSKTNVNVVCENLPNFEDVQARYLEVNVNHQLKLGCVYMPNGNPKPGDKFLYKLDFMKAFNKHAQKLLIENEYVLLGGDFNVIATDFDVYNPDLFKTNALTDEIVRSHLKTLEYMGYYDIYRNFNPKQNGYTFWDYTQSAFENDFGLRIDYFFGSSKMMDCTLNCEIDRSLRIKEKPSDHTPLVAEFDI